MNDLFYNSGAIYLRESFEKREYFYEDGRLKTVENYKQGRLHGEIILYWPNGKLKRRCHFVHGVRHGIDEMWSKEGTLLDLEEYAFGKPVCMTKT